MCPSLEPTAPLTAVLLLERNGSLGLGPRALPPGAGWAGIEGGGAQGGVAQAGGHQGLQKSGSGRVAALVYTHPPTSPQGSYLNSSQVQDGGHPGWWPFQKIYLEGLALISKEKKFWSSI